MTAVVEPVGLYANWSEKDKVGGRSRMAGHMNCLTLNFSSMRA